MVAVENSINVGSILWILYDYLLAKSNGLNSKILSLIDNENNRNMIPTEWLLKITQRMQSVGLTFDPFMDTSVYTPDINHANLDDIIHIFTAYNLTCEITK